MSIGISAGLDYVTVNNKIMLCTRGTYIRYRGNSL
jgi:hypothetical protein